MAEKFRCNAREWLIDDADNWICAHSNDDEKGPALVEDIYRAGALRVEVGGLEEFANEADTLFVTLPKDRETAIKIMALLAWQHGDKVDLVEGEKDVVRIWWPKPLKRPLRYWSHKS